MVKVFFFFGKKKKKKKRKTEIQVWLKETYGLVRDRTFISITFAKSSYRFQKNKKKNRFFRKRPQGDVCFSLLMCDKNHIK